jgi:hypothetical protein
MRSGGLGDREAITAAFDALDAAVYAVTGLNFDGLTTREWLALLARCEKVRRPLPVPEHQLINNLARQATQEELNGKLSHAIAEWTLITRAWRTHRAHLGRHRRSPARWKLAAGQVSGEPPLLSPVARLDRPGHPR